jgi:hypothetical protein
MRYATILPIRTYPEIDSSVGVKLVPSYIPQKKYFTPA